MKRLRESEHVWRLATDKKTPHPTPHPSPPPGGLPGRMTHIYIFKEAFGLHLTKFESIVRRVPWCVCVCVCSDVHQVLLTHFVFVVTALQPVTELLSGDGRGGVGGGVGG